MSVVEVVRRLRMAGVVVHEWPGWQTRSNGQSASWRGGLIHHTATAYGGAPRVLVDGRSDLDGPLCNFAGNADGSVTVIAAGPANHAGASGGRSMGPLPVTRSFNRYVMGLEIVYPGTQPMRDAQYRTALIWARIVADVVGGGDIEAVRAHAETSVTGKWDPGYAPGRTIDMARFRRDAAGARPSGGGTAPSTPVGQVGLMGEKMSELLPPGTNMSVSQVIPSGATKAVITLGYGPMTVHAVDFWGDQYSSRDRADKHEVGGAIGEYQQDADRPRVIPIPTNAVQMTVRYTQPEGTRYATLGFRA